MPKVRLTPAALRSWDNDDRKRYAAGVRTRDAKTEPVCPPRNMATEETFIVAQWQSPGRVWVRCPNKSEGFAPLGWCEWELAE